MIKKNAVVRGLAIDSVLVASAAYFVVWFYQPVMMKLGVPIAVYGLVHAGLLLSEILVSTNFSFLERFMGKGNDYLKNSAILVTLSFMLMAIFPSIWTLSIFVIIGGGIGYTRSTYITALAQKHIDSRIRSTTLSSIGMIRRFSLIFLNPLIGAIANYPKDYFMGMLPSSQYGSVAVLPSYLRSDLGSNLIVAGGIKSSNPDDNPTVINPTKTTSVITSNSNSSSTGRFFLILFHFQLPLLLSLS